MGITNLAKLIGDYAPNAIRENEIKNYFGRKVAVDASMCIYQFLIAVRQDGNNLTNEMGETTSHLMGMFYRTIRLMENGIKPLYVFDGKPPALKGGELAKRQERRAEAEQNLEKATEAGDSENVEKFTRRLVKVTKEHGEDCRKLLKFMGVPYIEAPCEAEAQCCALVKAGVCYAVGTEDMDALTFGGDVLLRHLTFSEARKMPIKEFTLSKVLDGMGLSQQEFVDLCILMGCDYCDTIKGIGPKRAIELVQKHKSIETILENIDTKKYPIPENWMFKEAREAFLHPEVTDPSTLEIKWTDVDVEGLVDYMCNQKGFNEDRIRSGAAKIAKSKTAGAQVRLDSFFKVTSVTNSAKKRKPEETKENEKKKSAKAFGKKFR